MTSPDRKLPDFDNPPVIETVVGVEFAPLEEWGIQHFGLLWDGVRDTYPNFSQQPPIISTEEAGPAQEVARSLMVRLSGRSAPIRCWMTDESDTRLLQVQNDRFIHNWRKVTGQEKYPHYEDSIRPTFLREWRGFLRFLEDWDISMPKVRRCEVSYINHLERGREWNTFADLADVFSGWPDAGLESGVEGVSGFSWKITYDLGDGQGKLRVEAEPGLRGRDEQEILQLKLIAKTKPEGSDLANIMSTLDGGREVVVRSFVELTSEKMHKLWERTA